MDLGLKGKKAFVTGASRGIGLRIARLLAAEGADIGICARDGAAVQQTVAELQGFGVKTFGAPADLKGDGSDLKAAIDGAAQAFGGLDILVQNVSAMAVQMRQKDWDAGYQVDILGTLRTVEAAMPWLQKSSAGSIVVIGSIAAVSGNGGPQPYGALKAALVHYVSGLAHSLGPQNIRANTVSPGAVFFEGGVWDQVKKAAPKRFDETVARNPMGRMATPEEVANAAVFLASPAASFITGVNLIVDGGTTQRVQF
ncbi:MAG: SDR family NAD(P)-dependent oxidoreductase [Pseudomonadota bacterium]